MSETDQLEPGPELDRMIAVEVMGWELMEIPGGTRIGNGLDGAMLRDWSPSANIAHAWGVVERIKSRMFAVFTIESHKELWVAFFSAGREYDPDSFHEGEGLSICVAICICALKAVRGEK